MTHKAQVKVAKAWYVYGPVYVMRQDGRVMRIMPPLKNRGNYGDWMGGLYNLEREFGVAARACFVNDKEIYCTFPIDLQRIHAKVGGHLTKDQVYSNGIKYHQVCRTTSGLAPNLPLRGCGR